jgi:histidine phosphotransferase ChpT
MQIDMRVMELLSSKICHDLVSPVSAINNGVELIEDIGGSVVDEAMKLIGNSASHASRRLRLFRMAYGRAGSEDSLGVKDVHQTAEQYLQGGKTMLVWDESQMDSSIVAHRGFLKVVLNMIIFSEEMLAYGGVATVCGFSSEGKGGCRIEVVGRGAQMSEAHEAAFSGTAAIEDLSPRTIQAYVTGRLAENFGLTLKFDHGVPDRLDLILSEPVSATLAA